MSIKPFTTAYLANRKLQYAIGLPGGTAMEQQYLATIDALKTELHELEVMFARATEKVANATEPVARPGVCMARSNSGWYRCQLVANHEELNHSHPSIGEWSP